MLKFVARAFEGFLGVILWINWVGCAITGAVMGWGAGGGGYAVLGFMLGAVVGIITNIVFGGLIVTFVNMSKEISEIRDYVKKKASGDTKNNNVRTAVGTIPTAARSVENLSEKTGSAGNDESFEVYRGTCPTCGKEVDGSSTEVRIYKTCNYCHGRL